MNLAPTITPKSDQLNADDLITGTLTIKVTALKGSNEPQQPVSIFYEGDNGKPYKPCKSMRRVLVSAWGANGAEYIGRSMTLYRDEAVVFGGIQVGGIRISHLSHIDKDLTMALTVSKTSRKPYTVRRLEVAQAPDYSKELAAIKGAASVDELGKLWPTLSANAKATTEVIEAAKNRKAELAQ